MGQIKPEQLATPRKETVLCVLGEMLTPLAEGALWWEAQETLIVSDLHLEKGSSYAAGGQMLPPYDSAATLSVVEGLVQRLQPQRVISLGDSFHDRQSEYRLSASCACRIRALTEALDWIWVEGNHDPDPPQHLGGRAMKTLQMEDLIFRHEPTGQVGEISGHLHPCAKIGSTVRTLRRKCFVTDGQRLVMPSLGAFTGGLNVLDEAFQPVFPDGGILVFAMGADQVFPVARKRLRRDGRRQSGVWRLKTGDISDT